MTNEDKMIEERKERIEHEVVWLSSMFKTAVDDIDDLKNIATALVDAYIERERELKTQSQTQRDEIFKKWCWALTFWKDEPIKLINNFSKYLQV